MFNANNISGHILTLLIFFPILAAFFVLFLPDKKQTCFYKQVALGAALIEFVFSLHLICHFVSESSYFQFSQFKHWLPEGTGIHYIVGVDGFSLILVLLTTSLTVISMLSAYRTVKTNVRGFLALLLILESAIVGSLVSLDVLLFYFFWEISLIPVYFMIGVWGGKNRIYATVKFFVYGVIGSLFMLVAFIYLYHMCFVISGHYSSHLLDLYAISTQLPFSTQCWLFLAIAFAFAIKVPVFPFYTWLPDTYEQAPAIYTLMSGVILKIAAYGLVRFAICLFPQAAAQFATPILILAVIGILYGALIAWRQKNARRIMAFSSLSHLGFIIVGIFAFNLFALQGALYQMVNHAVTAASLFILINFLNENRGTFDIDKFGGLAKVLPWFAFFFVIAAMGSVALPSTGSFVGEWLILIGTFQTHPVLASAATLGVITGPSYVLWMTFKILFGPITQHENARISPLGKAEVVQLICLSAAIFALGFASPLVLNQTQATLSRISETMTHQIPYISSLTLNGIEIEKVK